MSQKREVALNGFLEKVIVYTNDKGNEFVQLVLNIGSKKFFICDFKQNDALLLQVYKTELRESDKK